MANTRFKTENGLLVTGGNAQFDDVVRMNANLTVAGDLVLVTGDLQVQGAQIFTGGQLYTSDIVAETDGLNIANTTNQFNAFLGTVRVFDGLFPEGNTLPLGNTTSRFVITANTLNLSGNAAITGNLTVSNTMSVTGAVTLSNTLSVTNTVTFANTLILNDQNILPITTGAHITLRAGRNHDTSAQYIGLYNQAKITNTAMTAGRNHSSVRSELVNESRNLNSDGITEYNTNYYGYSTSVYNGNSAIGGNARANELFGVQAILANYANGSLANTVTRSNAGQFIYESRGSGVTTSSYGVTSTIRAENNSVTGNITTAYGVFARMESNTGMTIGTGYLYYGDHLGSTTTTKYGLYLTGEGNNYVSGDFNIGGKLSTIGTITGSANVNIDSGVLFVDSVTNRVGINNTAPGVALRVTGAADISSTANIQGNANVGGTLGVSSSVSIGGNLMVTDTTRTHYVSGNSSFSGGTLFINSVESRVGIGTSTPDVTLQVVGSANVTGASRFTNTVNIVGAVSLGNTLSVTNTSTFSNTISVTGAATLSNTLAVTGAVTLSNTLTVTNTSSFSNNASVGGTLSVVRAATLSNTLAVTGAVTLSNTLSATGAVTFANTLAVTGILTSSANVNFDSGVLFVDGVNNRVGINNTAPGVALRVTGAADISSTANVQGNANVGGTLGITGIATIANNAANTLSVGSSPWVIGGTGYDTILNGISNVHAGFYRTLGSTETTSHSTGLLVQTKFSNVGLTQGKYHDGVRTYLMNESQNKSADGSVQRQNQYYGVRSYVYNGNSSIGGDAHAQQLYGYAADVANYANGTAANTVTLGVGASFVYSSRGSGITTSGYGVRGTVLAGNNSITGNITTAVAVFADIESNTAMTIDTGYLYYGIHRGSTTTTKYGLYLTGESNNYMSGNVHVAGTVNALSYRIGTSTLIANSTGITHTGVINAFSFTIGTIGTSNGVIANSSLIKIGNSTANVTISSNGIIVASIFTANSTQVNSAVNTSISAIIANGSIGIDGQVLTSNSTGIYWGKKGSDKYVVDIGNGSATTFTITHNLNSNGVIVIVRENSTNYYVYPDIKYSTDNAVILEFVDAPTTNQYKVIAVG